MGGGTAVTGARKSYNQFIIRFLTELGSAEYDLDIGNEFLTNFKFGQICNDFQLVAFANTALAETTIQLASSATSDTPDDEIIASASLRKFAYNPPGVVLFIQLVTRAGDATVLQVPVTDVPLEEEEE